MVHLCEMMISPGAFFFHFFKTLVFWVVSELKGQKMSQTDKIIMSVVLYILGTIHHMIVIYGTQV